MGKTHAATGVCLGAWAAWGVRAALVPAPVLPQPLPALALRTFVAVAGAAAITWLARRAAYWPDLDHSKSCSTVKWGVFSRLVHEFVERLSILVFDLTATEEDKRSGSFRGHRGLTHFAVTALAVGAATGVLVGEVTRRSPSVTWGAAVGLVAAWYVSVRGFQLFGRRRRRRRGAPRVWRGHSDWKGLVALVVVAPLVTLFVPTPGGLDAEAVGAALGLGAGVAVAAGMLAHDLGDAATLSGVPLAWPLKIKGRRYYPVHVRREENRTRTSKDSPTERRVRTASWVLCTPAVLGWVPGLYEVALAGLA